MSTGAVFRLTGDAAVDHGVPTDAQFLCGFPEYETVTLPSFGDTPPQTVTRPTGRHILYFMMHPAISPNDYANATREAIRKDSASFGDEAQNMLRHLMNQQ